MVKRCTIRDITALKGQRPIVCLTSYTAQLAAIVDRYTDLILVGDSLGMVLYGMESTVPVTLDLMVNHGRAVVGATERSLIVLDMPFGTYQSSAGKAFDSAATLMKETGCGAVKLEGGSEMADTVSFLVQRGVPVMGHIGLQPQSVNSAGGYRVMGRVLDEKEKMMEDARALEESGAFSIVIECTDTKVAEKVTSSLSIPTIGIGASHLCDGQILVTEDMLGLSSGSGHIPKFVKTYAKLDDVIDRAVNDYTKEVKDRKFPGAAHAYASPDQETPKKQASGA